MATLDTLVTRFEADIIKFEDKMKQMASSSSRAAERVKKDHDQAADSISKAWKKSDFDGAMRRSIGGADSLRDSLLKIAPALAAAFSVKEAIAAADTYTRFTNSLKVAGLEGNNLATVQNALYQSAQKNGVALEPLSQLYGRASQSAKSLGATQSDLLKFTDGITAALRVQGGTTEQASGALIQLSQALGSGVIHAEEFNSINEGARPILEAVAQGSTKYAGSVAKLRADMLAGKLTSAEFFQDFLNGSSMLEAKAAKAPLTVAASWQVLENALAKGIGSLDSSYGVTQKISGGIEFLANNLDHVTEALGILAGVLGGAYVASAGKAVAATIATVAAENALSLSAATAAVASEGLSAALALVGGPWGIAIMAVAGAIGFLAVKGLEAKKAHDDLTRSIDEQYDALQRKKKAEQEAKEQTGNLTSTTEQAVKKVASLTGEVDLLTDAHWRAAAAAKAHRLEEANLVADKARTAAKTAREDYDKAALKNAAAQPSQQPATNMGVVSMPMEKAKVVETPEFIAARDRARKAKEVSQSADQDVLTIKSTSIKDDTFQPPKAETITNNKKGKGRSAQDIARSDNSAITSATNEELQARLANAQTAKDRNDAQVKILEFDHQQRLAAIDLDKNTSSQTKIELNKIEETTYQQKLLKQTSNSLKDEQDETDAYKKKIADARRTDLEAAAETARLNEDFLEWQARNAKTAAERADFEAQALASRQKRERDQAQLEIDLAVAAGDQIKAMRLKANLPLLVARQGAETQNQQNNGARDRGDWGVWAQDKSQDFDPAELNKSFQNIADNGLSDFSNGITDAIMGTKSLKAAFADTAKSIIASLIQIAVKMVVFKALGAAFPGLGKALSLGGHASGTDYSPGGLQMVGEKGPELMMLPKGTQVAPNNLLRAAVAGSAIRPGQSRTSITVNNHIDAKDAVVTAQVQEWIYAASVQTLTAARGMNKADAANASRNRLR